MRSTPPAAPLLWALRRRRRLAGSLPRPARGGALRLCPPTFPQNGEGGRRRGTARRRHTAGAVRSSLCPRAYRRGGIAPRHKTTLLCNNAPYGGIFDTKAGVLCSSRRVAAPRCCTVLGDARALRPLRRARLLPGCPRPLRGFRARAVPAAIGAQTQNADKTRRHPDRQDTKTHPPSQR